jgi:cysteine-rich repeat protein
MKVVPGGEAAKGFQEMDTNSNGKISLGEWEAAGNIQPPLALRITTFNRTVETYPMETAVFGPDLRQTPGTVHSGIIAVANPIEACGPLTGYFADRVVLAQRGTCEFCIKAKAAQAVGAKAVIIANEDETLLRMTYGTCGADVSIPSIMVPFSVGQELQNERYKAASIVFPTCLSGSTMKPGFGMEQCDDGNTVSGDGCSAQCISECGNGIKSPPEECDDGNQLSWVFTTARIQQVVKRNAATVTLLKPDATCQVCPQTPKRALHIASIVFSFCLALFYCVDSTGMPCVVRLAVLSARAV